ncbi:MAG: hypothetical protein KatS3mg110_3332 [Pirellulaceae bacterium]|nr:MAG: hypothetical protein KatS3mg110_3332 [Pirellulaceae bacterium]
MYQVLLRVVLLGSGIMCLSCGVYCLCLEVYDIVVLRKLFRRGRQKCLEDLRRRRIYRRRLMAHFRWCITFLSLALVLFVVAHIVCQ